MDYVTTVRVLIRETRQPLRNIKVELFDRDEYSSDDSLGVAHTNQFGEATFKYTTRDFADNLIGSDDQRVGLAANRDTVPDLYPVVYNSRGEVVICNRDEATRNTASLHILLLVDDAVAQAQGLTEGA